MSDGIAANTAEYVKYIPSSLFNLKKRALSNIKCTNGSHPAHAMYTNRAVYSRADSPIVSNA